ncbi:unnamed protein product [Rotaria sp. Silwood1]|nr:unnamed protein product [Rotaria sp. Silwood1]
MHFLILSPKISLPKSLQQQLAEAHHAIVNLQRKSQQQQLQQQTQQLQQAALSSPLEQRQKLVAQPEHQKVQQIRVAARMRREL